MLPLSKEELKLLLRLLRKLNNFDFASWEGYEAGAYSRRNLSELEEDVEKAITKDQA